MMCREGLLVAPKACSRGDQVAARWVKGSRVAALSPREPACMRGQASGWGRWGMRPTRHDDGPEREGQCHGWICT